MRRPYPKAEADVAQLAERVLGKDEVTSSILVIGSNSPIDGARARLPRRADGRRASSQRQLSPDAHGAEADGK